VKRSSFALVVVLALAACPGPASSNAVPKAASTQTTPVVVAFPDAGPASVALPVGFDELPLETRTSLQAIHELLPGNAAHAWEGWQIIPDGPQREERLAWLAKDFSASAFRRAQRLDEAVLLGHMQASPVHLGLIVVGFANCTQLADARAHISKAGRMNFALPVLTEFRTRARGHNLTFVLSETAHLTEVEKLFRDLDTFVGGDSTCSD